MPSPGGHGCSPIEPTQLRDAASRTPMATWVRWTLSEVHTRRRIVCIRLELARHRNKCRDRTSQPRTHMSRFRFRTHNRCIMTQSSANLLSPISRLFSAAYRAFIVLRRQQRGPATAHGLASEENYG